MQHAPPTFALSSVLTSLCCSSKVNISISGSGLYTCASPSVRYMIFDNGTLRVTDVQLNDTAEYSCEVVTDVDKVTAQASITVISVCVFLHIL